MSLRNVLNLSHVRLGGRISTAAILIAAAFQSPIATAQIEEIVVTARGVEQSVRDIPVAITTVDEEQMRNLSLKTLEDIASVTPQLDIIRASSGSGTSISIRGIGSTSTSIGIEQSVAVILDGVYYPQGRVINEGMFDARQVAIMKGPQALYFGKNATAGVLSMESNNPGDELEIEGKVGYETEQEQTAIEAIISGPITDTLGMRLAIRATDMDDGYMSNNVGDTTYTTLDAATGEVNVHDNPPPSDGYWPGSESFYGRWTTVWEPSDTLSFNLKATYSDLEYNSPTGGSELWNCPTLNGVPHRVEPPTVGLPVPNEEAECRQDLGKDENAIPPTVAATNDLLSHFGRDLGEDYESYSVTGTVDWSLDLLDIKAILNYHDQETNWVGRLRRRRFDLHLCR